MSPGDLIKPPGDSGMVETPSKVSREMEILAERLARIHGPVRLASESNGWHIYMACPTCLDSTGRRELGKKHLTVNATKYLEGIVKAGKFQVSRSSNDAMAFCHKEDRKFLVSDLLEMPGLDERGIKDVDQTVVVVPSNNPAWLETDGFGVIVPRMPGKLALLTDLPPEHPAVQYIRRRGLSPESMVRQFSASFCTEERPEEPESGVYYKRLPLGFKNTPQGRIIFFGAYKGSLNVWQGRVIDAVSESLRYYLHPYTGMWVPVEHRVGEKWEALPHVQSSGREWDIDRYKTANCVPRSSMLMGVDAAIQFNAGSSSPIAIITEGPMDAAWFGPPGIPILGKYISDAQLAILLTHFSKFIFAGQDDESSHNLEKRLREKLAHRVPFVAIYPQGHGMKDFAQYGEKGISSPGREFLRAIQQFKS